MENLENIQNIADPNESLEENNSTQTPEATAETQPSVTDDPEVRRLIEEAEQRGYIKGRNEQIDQVVMQPLDNPYQMPAYNDSDSCPSFLANIRPSVWD